jgi:aminoglycoside phosphotransferase (APT) family kinase protein
MPDDSEMPARLTRFLAARMPTAKSVHVDSYESVLGGFSRITARFRLVVDDAAQTLILRRDPPPDRETAHTDRGEEWHVMSALHRLGSVPLPEPRFIDRDGSELGTAAIVMEHVGGESLLRRAAAADQAGRWALAEQLIDLAVRIHTVDTTTLSELVRPPDWDSYIDGCIEQWRQIERVHPEPDPFIRYLASWLDQNRPPPAPLGLVHGDFQSTNVLVGTDGGLVALDWELPHIGDPREDLGWCKWNEAIQPPGLMAVDEERFCREYADRSGLGPDIVNPLTVGYFSVLSAVNACRMAYPSVAAFAQGTNGNLIAGYIVGYISTFHQQFVEVTKAIEDATALVESRRAVSTS